MDKLILGDRVILVNSNKRYHLDNGECGVITGVDENSYEVRFNNDLSNVYLVSEGELELEELFIDSSTFSQKVEKSDDVVTRPNHYTSHPSGIECKEIVGHYPFFVGSAIKYLWRAGLKTEDAVTDLRKAIQNIEFEIERVEKSND